MNRTPLGFDSIEFPPDCSWIKIIDQTLLPVKEEFLIIDNIYTLVDAITKLKVRGAPALGVVSAAGIAMSISGSNGCGFNEINSIIENAANIISNARPTAINLKWGVERMICCFKKNFSPAAFNLSDCKLTLAKEAHIIKEEDIKMSINIGERALSLLKPGYRLLTHCNAGHLATARYGTALAPIYLGNEKGYSFKIFATETRPLMQGARLTAYELKKAGADVTLICDNMVSELMRRGVVDAVLTGCDRIAANGDVANKIGTSSIAILSKHYNIPFYILGPESTIDRYTDDGDKIIIEERDGFEVTDMWFSKRVAPIDVNVFNPAFDITKSELTTAIITDKSIYHYPYYFSSVEK